MSDRKRKTCTLQFNLDAVNYTQNTSNSKAAEHYGVHISLINQWKNQKNSMESKGNKESKVVNRDRNPGSRIPGFNIQIPRIPRKLEN